MGGSVQTSISDAADILIDVMGGGTKVFLEGRHEVKEAYSTWTKSMMLLEYTRRIPETTLRDGLINMWNYAKTATPSTFRSWDKYEIDKGIYKFWEHE